LLGFILFVSGVRHLEGRGLIRGLEKLPSAWWTHADAGWRGISLGILLRVVALQTLGGF